ncbi:uncharacterized protein [Epargyreus clarus]|uniref:uncharacterized protein n=1 Tax=Epargyreus clarus TaxID=520877 RepID=UPI003C2C2EE8
MIFGILNKVAKNFHVLCKKNLIVTQRTGSRRSFTELNSEKETFLGAWPKVINAITTNPQITEIPEFANTIKQILDYNITDGKYAEGLSTILSYKYLEKPENITEESLEVCHVLGWCMEMVQAFWIVLDDITDRSVTRRGKPCWHLVPDVGLRAVNDSAIIYGTMLKILKIKCEHLPQYSKIMDQFHDALIYTATGQHLDYIMSNQKEKDYVQFTNETYDIIVKYKTSHYAHVLPVFLSLILANIDDTEITEKVKDIGYKIGRLHQMQNDFADCFPLESEVGNMDTTDINLNMSTLGTDIQEGKCSWLAVTALQNCNEAQRKTFTRYYGSPDPGHVEEIKILYEQLKLPEIYKQEKRMRLDEVSRLAHDFNYFPRAPELFLGLLKLFTGKK